MEQRERESNLPAPTQYSSGNTGLVTGMPSQQELMVYQTWAKNAAESQMYRNVGKEAGIMMIMLAAREYGIGPAQALNGGLHIIEGKVELSARVMSALIRRARHTLQILESTDEICRIKGTRADTGEAHTVTFTIAMAQKAGLIKDKGGWKRTPEDMLYARCVSRLARQLFSDVIGIGYIEGEISDSRASNDVSDQSIKVISITDATMTVDLFLEFEIDDHELLDEYIELAAQHYGWTKEKTLEEFCIDIEATKKRFLEWKKKRKPNEV